MSRFLLVCLAVAMILAAFLRLYRFETFMEFLDDQGRDAIVIKRILIDHDLTLLGPGTSVGKMYLGPLYYYAMVPFLAMTYPEPTGPAYAIALLGVITAFLVYHWGKELVGQKAAAIAALLYAVAPVVVKLSRFSWQPNPAPFFGLCMIWAAHRAFTLNKAKYWIVVGICFTVLTQLHYVALLSAVPVGAFFLIQLRHNWKGRAQRAKLLLAAFLSVIVLAVSTLPLGAFDLRHQGLISAGFKEFLSKRSEGVTLLQRGLQFASDLDGRGMYMTVELLGFSKEHRQFNSILVLLLLVGSGWALKEAISTKNPQRIGMMMIALWVWGSILALTAYRDTIYSHYFAYLFPAVFLMVGMVLNQLSSKHVLAQTTVIGAICIGVIVNIRSAPIWNEAPYGLQDLRAVKEIVQSSIREGEKYNIALLNDNREYRGMKYRYYLETAQKTPLSQYEYEKLDALVVIVENGESPLASPVFEIQQFVRDHPDMELVTQQSHRGIVSVYVYR
jgi:hypothetical protein